MKIITCTGFLGTGSSAITDFFSEFSNCSSIGNYELRFIHEPHGIRDLEFNLIQNNHRHNTSHAIKEFMKYMKHLEGNSFRKGYKRYFGDGFENAVRDYLDEIVELSCETWWNYDQISRGEIFNDLDLIYQKIIRKIDKRRIKSILSLIHEKGYYTAISEEEFCIATKKFITNVLTMLNTDSSEYLMIDQLLPPTNIDQYLHYFDDIKVFIVDRDPRDCYLIEATEWHSGTMPYKNIDDYCKWFEIIRRKSRGVIFDSNKVMRIQFEDLIYKYDEMKKIMTDFVGISSQNHNNVKQLFNPEISIKNTNLIRLHPEYIDEIHYIEKKLPQYLFDFNKYK